MVKLWDGVVAVPLVGTLDSARAQVVMERLLQTLVDTGSPYAIIDITGVPAVDTQVAQHILKTVVAARLMGAECIISGIRPQIAQTIVALGIEFGDIATKATLADALRHALRLRRRRGARRAARELVMDRVPILKIGDILLVSIQVDLQDQTALALQEDLAERIVATGCHGVIIDITALDIVDSFVGRMLSTIASISRVLDAETVVVGMRPAVAITLVELGPVAGRASAPRSTSSAAWSCSPSRGTSTLDGFDAPPRRLVDTRRRPGAGRAVTAGIDLERTAGRDDLRRRGRRPRPPAGPRRRGGGQAVAGRPDQAGHRRERAGPQHPGLRRRRLGRGRRPSTTAAAGASGSCSPTTGPGIADLDLALTDGYTTGGGLASG